MTTSTGVVVKWKTAQTSGGSLSFDGTNLKPIAQIDPTEAFSYFNKLELEDAVYVPEISEACLEELRKVFAMNLAAGLCDVATASLSGYESQFQFPMPYRDLTNLMLCEDRTQVAEAWMLHVNGDLVLHFKGTGYTLRIGKKKLLAKNQKEQSRLDALYHSNPNMLAQAHTKWSAIYATFLTMKNRACEATYE